MSAGRTVWRAKDAAWHDREWIVDLVEEFGPSGYAVIDCLESFAKMQNDGGRVKTGPKAIGRATGVAAVTVGHVVSHAVTLGLLDEYEDRDGRFTCRVTWFVADQGKAMAANRKAKQRAGDPIEPDDLPPLSRSVPSGHGESRPVTECPPTGQDRTGQSKGNVSSSDASGADPKATDDDVRLCRVLAEAARERNPKFKVKSRASWLTDMRRLREIDDNTPEEIERVIRWVFTDSFWGGVIQSPGSLREHFAAIWDRMHQGSNVVPLNVERQERRRRGSAALDELMKRTAEESA